MEKKFHKKFSLFNGSLSSCTFYVERGTKGNSDTLRSFGDNISGLLCHGDRNNRTKPKKVKFFKGKKVRIKKVAVGFDHSLFLTEDISSKIPNLKVWGCGQSKRGQLGMKKGRVLQPVLIPWLDRIKICDIACGSYHSVFLCGVGVPYSTGSNLDGQLGNGNFGIDIDDKSFFSAVYHVAPMRTSEKFKMIACGNGCTLLLSKKGQVFETGKLFESIYLIPTKILMREEATRIAVGFEHALILGKSSRVWGYGANSFMQLTNKYSKKGVENVVPIGIKNVIDVKCGFHNSYALCDDLKCYGWGRSKYNECNGGIIDSSPPQVPFPYLLKNNIVQMECGSFFIFLFQEFVDAPYCCGINGSGELGIKETRSVFKFKIQPFIEEVQEFDNYIAVPIVSYINVKDLNNFFDIVLYTFEL